MNFEGRIVRSLGGFYTLRDGEGRELECRARGVFRKQNIKPCVGDWALAEVTEEGSGYVLELRPRKNALVRPPLANLDQLIMVVSIVDPAPNTLVLDKLLAIAEMQKIEPVVAVTKADLSPQAAADFAQLYSQAGFPTALCSSVSGQGLEELRSLLTGKLSAFCGNSGAGKSSLLNALDSRLGLGTGDISQKLGRGRHTTRHVEIYDLGNGAQVADTPGFSAVDLEKFQRILKDELALCFRDFAPWRDQCRFSSCSHTKEKGCAVLEAVAQGKIAPSRHQSYVTLYEEAKQIKEWEIK